MRKVAVGLLGLSLTATGLAFGPSASAAPQPKLPAAAPAAAEPQALKDELPDKLEDKRRALREQGLETVLARHTCAHRVDELLAIHAELEGEPTHLRSIPA